MSFELHVNVRNTVLVSYLKVSAGVRYWEVATVNGVKDTDGDYIIMKIGPDGQIDGWPSSPPIHSDEWEAA